MVKRTTHQTRLITEESQPSALKEADILQIVDAVKKGLSDFAAGTQISNTLPTHQEDEFDKNGEYYISLL